MELGKQCPLPKFALCSNKDHTPEEELWFAFLQDAVDDLALVTGHRYCSFYWFLSERFEIGSFLWVCFHLDLSPSYLIYGLSPKLRRHLRGL